MHGEFCILCWKCLAIGCITSSLITESSSSAIFIPWLLCHRLIRTSFISGEWRLSYLSIISDSFLKAAWELFKWHFPVLLLWLTCFGVSQQYSWMLAVVPRYVRQPPAHTWQQRHESGSSTCSRTVMSRSASCMADKGQCLLLVVSAWLVCQWDRACFHLYRMFNSVTTVKLVLLNSYVRLILSQIRELIWFTLQLKRSLCKAMVTACEPEWSPS